ncbi:helicase [Microbacterium sp.]|uniref:helicase n=1 Tax=Microbacterium sp. TaxID=51671 RepID=UPI0039E63C41
MAGSALAVGVLAVSATLGVGYATAGAVSVRAAQVAGVADAAALAAADAASGAVSGLPCERAAQLAARGGAGVVSCTVDGLVATIEVTASAGVFPLRARARAGPPP